MLDLKQAPKTKRQVQDNLRLRTSHFKPDLAGGTWMNEVSGLACKV